MPEITGIPFWTITLFKGEACRRMVTNPFLFLWILAHSLDPVSFHTNLLESIDIWLSIARNLHFFPLPLDLPLAAAATEAALHVAIRGKRKCFSRFFCSKYQTTIFSVWCSFAIHSCEQHLACTETAMAPAVLTVEAGSSIIYPEFLRRFASSSHRVLHDCTFSIFNLTFNISLRFKKKDSCVSLTLKYS